MSYRQQQAHRGPNDPQAAPGEDAGEGQDGSEPDASGPPDDRGGGAGPVS